MLSVENNMQVKVPKFIDIEDRVVMGLTWKQFVYLSLATGFTFVVFSFFQTYIAVPLAAIVLSLAVGLAFAKVNARPFKIFLITLWRFNFNPRRYSWEKMPPEKITRTKPKTPQQMPDASKRVSPSDLKRIAAALDVHERGSSPDENFSEPDIPPVAKAPASVRVKHFRETPENSKRDLVFPDLNDDNE